MKLDMPKKITIGICAMLLVWASFLIVSKIVSFRKMIKSKSLYYSANRSLLKREILDSANKYKLYSDIFNSKEPVLIFGYTPAGLSKLQNEQFKKELMALVEEKNIKHKIIAVNNLEWEKIKEVLEDKYSDDSATCTMVSKEQNEVEDFMDFLDECFSTSCIIDVKNKSLVRISRNAEFIVKTLSGDVKIIDD